MPFYKGEHGKGEWGKGDWGKGMWSEAKASGVRASRASEASKARSRGEEHHPNFYNFFPIAIAPFTGRMGNRGKFRMVDIFDTKAVYTTAAV